MTFSIEIGVLNPIPSPNNPLVGYKKQEHNYKRDESHEKEIKQRLYKIKIEINEFLKYLDSIPTK